MISKRSLRIRNSLSQVPLSVLNPSLLLLFILFLSFLCLVSWPLDHSRWPCWAKRLWPLNTHHLTALSPFPSSLPASLPSSPSTPLFHPLTKGSANVSCKRPESKHTRPCGPCCLCQNYQILPLDHDSSHRQYINNNVIHKWIYQRVIR